MKSVCRSTTCEEKKEDSPPTASRTEAARQGLLRKIKEHFSSTPLYPEELLPENAALTEPEKAYLQDLIEKGDLHAIETASMRLSDPTLFPATPSAAEKEEQQMKPIKRRKSQVQQQLFKLHETREVQPSQMLQRLVHRNSILESTEFEPSSDEATEENEDEVTEVGGEWNPFKDLSSWIDGGQGVEVMDGGDPFEPKVRSPKASFKILGTAADDVSCHPHVLSPPLMESLLAFIPESLSDCNFWLKSSLVRDGASLWKMVRQVRASNHTFLAIETVDGQVFGSFSSHAWRLAQGWYGCNESFLWKMRHNRCETTKSIVQQVCHESEIQVFPYRSGNVAVQYCSKDCLKLGQGELLPNTDMTGEHFGHGIYLEADLLSGSTSTCETFGNPCLIDDVQRGEKFQVSNIEVWTLTPHECVIAAERSELSMLFLDGRVAKNLNLMDIVLGGGPI
jgi:hypothetical protein